MKRCFFSASVRKTQNRAVWLQSLALALALIALLLLGGCGSSSTANLQQQPPAPVVWTVNSLDDIDPPASGTMTLRSAFNQAASGEVISFNSALDGATIRLSIVGESHSSLLGEVYSGMQFVGYSPRDYGPSALYANKDVILDASDLPHGVTIQWTGGDATPARVIGLYGNLTLRNVSITGGNSVALPSNAQDQPYTLARGGGLAVWGTATLENCSIYGNKIVGDSQASRDRGTYGGGIYANGLSLSNCVVSGNRAVGYGAAGGGIYSVGGADNQNGIGNNASLSKCAITGNRVTAQHAYGGGIFSLSGGPNNLATMTIRNCTIARNLAEDNPDLPEVSQYYYRGGGVYLGGGSLSVISSTIAENEVNGPLAIFNGKPNQGGGGVAATIGNAHTVENVELQHSIVVGNKLNGAPQDWFTGSLLMFYSNGYNRLGNLDFSQILVPVPEWMYLSRKHYPEPGDLDGLDPATVLDYEGIQLSDSIISAGTDAGQRAVLWYSPGSTATDQVPATPYSFYVVRAGYTGWGLPTDDFLNHALNKVRADYGATLGSDFGSEFGDMTGVTWYGPAETWPTNPQNAAWISFWQLLDTDLNGRLGMANLNDNFWATFQSGPLGDNVNITVTSTLRGAQLMDIDQRGNARPKSGLGDIGAIEK